MLIGIPATVPEPDLNNDDSNTPVSGPGADNNDIGRSIDVNLPPVV